MKTTKKPTKAQLDKVKKIEKQVLKSIRDVGPWVFRSALSSMRNRSPSFPAAQQSCADELTSLTKLQKLVDALWYADSSVKGTLK
jgi:hypothetical protein